MMIRHTIELQNAMNFSMMDRHEAKLINQIHEKLKPLPLLSLKK